MQYQLFETALFVYPRMQLKIFDFIFVYQGCIIGDLYSFFFVYPRMHHRRFKFDFFFVYPRMQFRRFEFFVYLRLQLRRFDFIFCPWRIHHRRFKFDFFCLTKNATSEIWFILSIPECSIRDLTFLSILKFELIFVLRRMHQRHFIELIRHYSQWRHIGTRYP